MTDEFKAEYTQWLKYLEQLGYRKVVLCKECALRDTFACQIHVSMYGLKDDDFCSYGYREEIE